MVDPGLVGVDLPMTLNCTGSTTGTPGPGANTFNGPFTFAAQMRFEYAPSLPQRVWRASLVPAPTTSTELKATLGWTHIESCGMTTLRVVLPNQTTWDASSIRTFRPNIDGCSATLTIQLASPTHFTLAGSSRLVRKQLMTGITYTNNVSCTGTY